MENVGVFYGQWVFLCYLASFMAFGNTLWWLNLYFPILVIFYQEKSVKPEVGQNVEP
jgi:hypothetical protein